MNRTAGDALPEVAPVRAGEELDSQAVLGYMAAKYELLELSEPPQSVEILQFPGGRANLTYLLRVGDREFVLRRPPLGKLNPGAHDMGREFTVLARLWRVFDRAPRAFTLCDDPAVIGAPFFLMERHCGTVIRFEIPDTMRHHDAVERRVSFALVDALVDLHKADYREAGLSGIGKPDGFLDRQLHGWARRWDLSKTEDYPDFYRLGQWLQSHQPRAAHVGLIHNDPKLDNCQFDPARPDRVSSMFDWDMATLGPTLLDLGTLLAYWTEAQAQHASGQLTSAFSIFATPGFPSREEVAEYYAQQASVDLHDIAWYEGFALWKSAVVSQQIYARYLRGQTRDERFAVLGARVADMLAAGLRRSGADGVFA